MKNYLIAPLAIVICLSCSDDDINFTPNATYFPMAIGNYWIYQTHLIPLGGMETIASELDSVVITGDTLVDGNTYFVFEGTDFISNDWRVLYLRREEGDNIVDQEGNIHLSATNFTDVLHEQTVSPTSSEWITTQYKTNNSSELISVPAGDYEVLDHRGLVQSNILAPYPLPRFVHNYYAPEVGLVLRNTFAFTSGTTLEDRLVRFHIEN